MIGVYRNSGGSVISCAVVVVSCVSCSQPAVQNNWPDLPLLIVDEKTARDLDGKHAVETLDVQKVIVLPIVSERPWEASVGIAALEEPIIITPGKDSVARFFADYYTEGKTVNGCILLAKGCLPRGMDPAWNYTRIYHGKRCIVKGMVEVPWPDARKTARIIVRELGQEKLVLSGKTAEFQEALNARRILECSDIRSPYSWKVYGYDLGRDFMCLWSRTRKGRTIEVKVSAAGQKRVARLLGVD